MKKDIVFPKVEGVSIAIVHEEVEGEMQWNVYVVNEKKDEIYGVLVVCKGYGTIDNEEKKTAQMRYFLGAIQPGTCSKVESLPENLLQLSNEYWLSFYHQSIIYDKKFIFLAGSIDSQHFTNIPVLNKQGIYHI